MPLSESVCLWTYMQALPVLPFNDTIHGRGHSMRTWIHLFFDELKFPPEERRQHFLEEFSKGRKMKRAGMSAY